ncbi:AP2-domain-containing protein, partial [Haematococcus lacustris]
FCRWEAHIWIKDLGRQVYLGGYEHEEHAAEAYDVAALKTKGLKSKTNFPQSRYEALVGCIDSISVDEIIMAVRRQSQGFSRGTSSFRGVTAHPSGRWESRIGIPQSKHVYLGLFDDEREAALAYDRALVRLRGTAAATNFGLAQYNRELAEFNWVQDVGLDTHLHQAIHAPTGAPSSCKLVRHELQS